MEKNIEYNDKYIKYKKRYLKEKSNFIKNLEYEFIYFDNMDEQINFFEKHKKSIVNMTKICFPHNYDLKLYQNKRNKNFHRVENIWHEFMEAVLRDQNYKHKQYFVVKNNKVVGYCFLYDNFRYFKTRDKLKSHSIHKSFNDIIKVEKEAGPIIMSLCKDMKYENVGNFLLKNMFDYLKDYHKRIYLIPESIFYKNNFEDYFGSSRCIMDLEKYKNSNKRLLNFYKKNNLKILEKSYFMIKCGENLKDDRFLSLHILYRDLF